MKRRRLLSLGHSYVVDMNRRLAHELARQGGDRWEVKCVAPAYFHGGNDLAPVAFQAAEDEACTVEPVNAYSTRWVHVFWYGHRLREILREGWDLVHAWEEPYILAGFQIAAWTPRRTRLVFRTAQNQAKKYPPPFDAFERFSMRRAAGWICSGKMVERNLSERPGYELPRLRSPLGVDTRLFTPSPELRRDALGRLGWSADGPPVVGFAGRFTQAKGLPLLLDVLRGLRSPYRALFLGAGDLEGDLRSFEKENPSHVRILRTTHDEVPLYMNAVDALCVPSQTTPAWQEQFGRVVVEAMACAVPVLGSDSGEISNVLGDGGLILPESDVNAWRSALEGLLESPERRRRLGEAGLERARSHYAWERVGSDYLAFFDKLLS